MTVSRLLVLVILIGTALYPSVFDSAQDPLILFLLPPESLHCPACLDGLLDICRRLSPQDLSRRCRAIVIAVGGDSGRIDSLSLNRSRRMIQGLFDAEGIPVPVLVDGLSVLEEASSRGALLLFDGRESLLRCFAFPLSDGETELILRSFRDQDG